MVCPKHDDSFHHTISAFVCSPLFVTLTIADEANKSEHLRGCIGCLSPVHVSDLASFALKSAFEDRRFRPLTWQELPACSCAVSLLINFQDCSDLEDWELGQHGIKIHFNADSGAFSATFLPEVASEQGWTKRETLLHLISKAGYKGEVTTEILQSVSMKKYESSKVKASWSEFLERCDGNS